MTKRLTPEADAKLTRTLLTGYKNGFSIRELAAANQVSYGKVHRTLRVNQVTFRPRGGPRRKAAS